MTTPTTSIQVFNKTDQTLKVLATNLLNQVTAKARVGPNSCLNLNLNGGSFLTACSLFGLCSAAVNVSVFSCVGLSFIAGTLTVSPLLGCPPCPQPVENLCCKKRKKEKKCKCKCKCKCKGVQVRCRLVRLCEVQCPC